MKNTCEIGFWFWSHKLVGILSMLADISKYELNSNKLDLLKYELLGTNEEQNKWSSYTMKGLKHNIHLKLAYDAEESTDMLHTKITASKDLKETLELINLFQAKFNQLEIE